MDPTHLMVVCTTMGWNWNIGSEKEVRNFKDRQMDGHTDTRQKMNSDQKSSPEMRAKNEIHYDEWCIQIYVGKISDIFISCKGVGAFESVGSIVTTDKLLYLSTLLIQGLKWVLGT